MIRDSWELGILKIVYKMLSSVLDDVLIDSVSLMAMKYIAYLKKYVKAVAKNLYVGP